MNKYRLFSTVILSTRQRAQDLVNLTLAQASRLCPFISVIQSPLRAKNLIKHTPILFLTLLLFTCTPYTDPTPTKERAIYPTECDYSPIEFGSIHIYDTDSTFLSSIEIDHQYVPLGAYRINHENDTYLFKLHSDYTNKTAFFKITIHLKTQNIDLNICDGD